MPEASPGEARILIPSSAESDPTPGAALACNWRLP